MARPDWNDRYRTNELPWDTGVPDPHLVELAESGALGSGRALEIGCGTGTNASFLADQGFEVVGIDLSEIAIERARERPGTACTFEVLDFLTDDPPGGEFDLVFDRGCLHVFDEAADRARFAGRVAALLAERGRWVSIVGSTEGPERDHGPPRRSAFDLVEAIEPVLELVSIRGIEFHAVVPTPARGWLSIAGQRDVPAQPSTVREGGRLGPVAGRTTPV